MMIASAAFHARRSHISKLAWRCEAAADQSERPRRLDRLLRTGRA